MATETLTFTTPKRKRLSQPVEVDLCGEQFTVERPKDAVLYFAQAVIGDSVGEADRAAAVLQFLNSTLEPMQRQRYFERCIAEDDPVDLRATMSLVGGLTERWADYPETGHPEPVIVEATADDGNDVETVEIVNDDLNLYFTAHRPKDVILLFAAASLGIGSNLGQQSWAVGLFLDAALTPQDALVVAMRMRNQQDDLDLADVAEIVSALAQRWAPQVMNREQRRAAARKPAAKTTTKAPARSSTRSRSTAARAR
jgi:hypothetical protein